jgi:hypothetical protein
MTPGSFDVVAIIASWAVSLPAVTGIVVWDERRLRGKLLERAWPPQSRDAAIFGLWLFASVHPLALAIHFIKTRWSLVGVLLGVGATVAVVALEVGAEYGAALAVDWLGL